MGSRNWKDESHVRALVASLPVTHGNDFTLVSGGAAGVDTWAADQAMIARFNVDILPAKWEMFGKIAGILRNQELVDSCDKVYIFWDGKSPGSRHVIQYCKKQKKDFEVIGAV